MTKSKVALSLVAVAALAGIAYSQLMQQEDKPATAKKSEAVPVSIPAPSSTKANAPAATKTVSNTSATHVHHISQDEPPKPAESAEKQQSPTRSSLTARQQDLPKDHRQDHHHARPHGHEEHTNSIQPRRPPGEPKKPLPSDNAPKG